MPYETGTLSFRLICALGALFQKHMNQLFIDLPVGLIPHGQIQPGLFIYDAFFVRKCIKSFFPMIGTHPAFAETAESHFTGGKVNNRIVDASAAESAAGGDFAGSACVGGKDVKRQRMRQRIRKSEPAEWARRSLPA